jgi:hypothetical protein
MTFREQGVSLSVRQDKRFYSLDKSVQQIIDTLLNDRVALNESLEALTVTVKQESVDTRNAIEKANEDRCKRKVMLSLLESLRFETMTFRHEAIPDAHKRTFEWIFEDSKSPHKSWGSFCKWLESGTGVFWINGKPGSGKSTLMRFIVEDPRTHAHLQSWAPNGILETPSFFFWNSGVLDQRSQVGLFRSILYTVLRNHQSLIPIIFPEEWKINLENSHHDVPISFSIWSLARLKKCFERLMNQASENMRFCLIIDGLDEYEGDHDELALYFSGLTMSPFVKFCLSSRPLLAFEEAFKDFLGLRLENLTRDDIQLYVENKINEAAKKKSLTLKSPEEIDSLIREVIRKADGVFLWVTLVVTSLLRGLKQFDNISALWKRLEHLPPGMEKLYQHMLASIDPLNMEEGSKIFQIIRAQLHTRSEAFVGWLTVENLTLALTADLQQALTLNPETGVPALGTAVLFVHEKSILDAKLRTHCGGLLQIGHRYRVEFIHRTARDYLEKKDVWDDLLTQTNGDSATGFDACFALLIAYIIAFKRFLVRHPRDVEVLDYFFEASRYGKFVCPYNLHAQMLLLDEFDRAAMVAYRSAKVTKDERNEFDPSTHWSALIFPVRWKTTFLSMASYQTVNSYVERKLSTNTRLLEQGTGLPLLGFIFLSSESEYSSATSDTWGLIEILLAQGLDPNERYEGVTIWQYWVHHMHCYYSYGQTGAETLPTIKRIFKSMLNCGVDLHVCCIMDSQIWESVYREEEMKRGGLSRDYEFVRRRLINHSKRNNGIRDESLESSFEEIHSLSAVITELFNTEQDPHGADELLEYIAMLKDQNESTSHGGAGVGQGKKNKKKNRKKGKNSGA